MSNRRKSRRDREARRVERSQILVGPRDTVDAIAAGFRCPDCASQHGARWVDPDGRAHVVVEHDAGCPYLTGATS